MSDPASLKHTPLESAHVACGARMVEFGGWFMPVQYSGIMDEHKAVRSASGMFDISHMGEVTVEGPGALAWLESLLTNRVGKLAVTRGQYTLMLNAKGGVIDDLIIYRTGEMSYFLVINGACRDLDLEWMRSRLPADGSVVLKDQGDDYAAIALQGPDSEKILKSLYPACEVPKRNGIATLTSSAAAVSPLVARTGYTGEDGFELFVPVADGIALWESLLAAVTPLRSRLFRFTRNPESNLLNRPNPTIAMNVPADLRYAKTHEWIRVDGDTVTVGITDHAQAELTDIVYAEPPKVGAEVKAGATAAVVESVKAASDIYSPLSGTVTEVNAELSANPALLNTDPFGQGWIYRMKASNPAEAEDLLAPEAYTAQIS